MSNNHNSDFPLPRAVLPVSGHYINESFSVCTLSCLVFFHNVIFFIFIYVAITVCITNLFLLIYGQHPTVPPKMDGSWWRVLTECGPLEKGMANHFSILALRTP